jgi:hypothetical protein
MPSERHTVRLRPPLRPAGQEMYPGVIALILMCATDLGAPVKPPYGQAVGRFAPRNEACKGVYYLRAGGSDGFW